VSEDPQDTSLEGLMAQAQNGDQEAYRQVLEQAVPLVRKVVNERWQGDPQQREDIVQDILMHIHNARHTYDPVRPFRPWLYAIARYRVIEAIRYRSRRGQEFQPEPEVFETFTVDDTNRTLDDLAAKDTVSKAMAKLPEKQKRTIELVKLEGLSMREAAAKLNMTETATKVTSHRAMKALRQIIEQDLQQDDEAA